MLCCFQKHFWFGFAACRALSLAPAGAHPWLQGWRMPRVICPRLAARRGYGTAWCFGVWASSCRALHALGCCMSCSSGTSRPAGMAGPSFGPQWGSPPVAAAAVGLVGVMPGRWQGCGAGCWRMGCDALGRGDRRSHGGWHVACLRAAVSSPSQHEDPTAASAGLAGPLRNVPYVDCAVQGTDLLFCSPCHGFF